MLCSVVCGFVCIAAEAVQLIMCTLPFTPLVSSIFQNMTAAVTAAHTCHAARCWYVRLDFGSDHSGLLQSQDSQSQIQEEKGSLPTYTDMHSYMETSYSTARPHPIYLAVTSSRLSLLQNCMEHQSML